ncbi:hypothetical protein FQA39_LY17933 [Lamprigera yunnana]|nr:hypothetical protein FQA39_LY17933 [Lamprigera yunnana]
MRIALSIAITEMVSSPNSDENEKGSCSGSNETGQGPIISNPEDTYDWDEETQGLILSSFYWGYIITHMPGGILAEKFGGKYSLGSVYCRPPFLRYSPRLLLEQAIGSGCAFSECERSRLGSLTFAGSLLGTVIGNSVSGILIKETQSWASVFYLFGGLGVVWFIIWIFLCYSDPESHPFISDKEKQFLKKELANISNGDKDIPWRAIWTSVPLWALIAAQIGHDWGFFAMVTDLPKYMKDVLKFRIDENGIWSSLPYVVMWLVSIGSGWLCDWIIKKKYMTITFARKFFTTIAALGPAIFIVGAGYSGCDRYLAVGLFTVAMGLMGTFYCGMKVNALDLSPNFAGTLMAIVNGMGAISGIITPYLIGALTMDHSVEQWRLVFWITLGVLVVTNIIYVIFASGEAQWWNVPDIDKFATFTRNSDVEFGKKGKNRTTKH